MDEEQRFIISRSLNGDKIVHIARNSNGQIIARELSLEKLQIAIKKYKESPPVKEEAEELKKPKEKKFLINKLAEKVQKRKEGKEEKETSETPSPEEPQKDEKETPKLLKNDLKDKVEERKKQEESKKKKSFWDKLK